MKNLIKFVVLSFLILSCAHVTKPGRYIASKGESPFFGPEWTFTNSVLEEAGRKAGSNIVNTPENEAARDELAQKIMKACDNCVIESFADKYGADMHRIYVDDNKWFIDVTVDPWVVEVKTSPLTAEQFKSQGDFIQRVVFDSAKEIGITPSVRSGGGHIHIDLERAFEGDVMHFKNFLVDMTNNSFLNRGTFGDDQWNAPTLAELTKKQQQAFQRIIDDVNANPKKWTIKKLAKKVESEVYTANPADWNPTHKYQNLNLTRVGLKSDATVEIRGFHAQKDATHFVAITELLDKRIEWIKTQKNIAFEPKLAFEAVSSKMITNRLWKYSFEAGVEFDRLKSYSMTSLRGLDPEVKMVWPLVEAKLGREEGLKYMINLYGEDYSYPRDFVKSLKSMSQDLDPEVAKVAKFVLVKNQSSGNCLDLLRGIIAL